MFAPLLEGTQVDQASGSTVALLATLPADPDNISSYQTPAQRALLTLARFYFGGYLLTKEPFPNQLKVRLFQLQGWKAAAKKLGIPEGFPELPLEIHYGCVSNRLNLARLLTVVPIQINEHASSLRSRVKNAGLDSLHEIYTMTKMDSSDNEETRMKKCEERKKLVEFLLHKGNFVYRDIKVGDPVSPACLIPFRP